MTKILGAILLMPLYLKAGVVLAGDRSIVRPIVVDCVDAFCFVEDEFYRRESCKR
jgi:hypothetical protein